MKYFMLIGIPLSLALLVSCGPRKPPPAPAPPPEPKATPAAPPKVEDPEGNIVRALQQKLADIHFDFDKADIRDDAKPTLEANAAAIKSIPDVKVVVEGHCDERGSVEYNLALGERRARAARDYLMRLGVPAGRLQSVSYGKELPLEPGHDERAWAANRRAHFLAVQQ